MLEPNTTIGGIVADDYPAAAVFERHGIDFCCGGNRPVADACREVGVDVAVLSAELDEALSAGTSDAPRFATWDLDALVTYIVANHHGYIRRVLDGILAHTRKVADVHGERHPEVKEIAAGFAMLSADLLQHLSKEERVLFPYIQRLVDASRGGAVPPAPFGEVANPIRMMEAEHEAAGAEMARIRTLSDGYAPPADACATFTVTYQELDAFEADLHRHVHLENNILFPRALDLERRVRAAARPSADQRA